MPQRGADSSVPSRPPVESENQSCPICYEDDFEEHVFPCGHGVCTTCAPRCHACPFCRYPLRESRSVDASLLDQLSELVQLAELRTLLRLDLDFFTAVQVLAPHRRLSVETCFVCGRTFSSAQALLQHQRDMRHNLQHLVCWCGRSCASPQALFQHQRDTGHLDEVQAQYDSGSELYESFEICNVCDRFFLSSDALSQHQRDTGHEIESPHPRIRQEQALPQRLYDVENSYSVDHVCRCGRAYASLEALLQHQRDTGHLRSGAAAGSRGPQPLADYIQVTVHFVCWCGRPFSSPEALHQHQRDTWHLNSPADGDESDLYLEVPAPQQNYCDACHRAFGSSHALAQHQRATGHGEYSIGYSEYACWCGRECGTRHALFQHQRDAGHLS